MLRSLAAGLMLAGCASTPWSNSADSGASAQAQAEGYSTIQARTEQVAGGLTHPWALTSLPDGRMLVTERPGRLRYVGPGGALSEPIAGVPAVWAQGQGGLLDVALDPGFARNNLIYLSYAEPGADGAAGTAVARGRLNGQRLEDVQVIFRQDPKVRGPNHFGSRLVFAPDGSLFITLGERFQYDPAQDSKNTLGALVRIRPDGSIPPDNPFLADTEAADAIWSIGHRNIQSAAIHPQSGRLWVAEMGPEGGDELNVPEAGRNYGWPIVSWGRHYNRPPYLGADIPDPPTRPELAQSIRQWTPVISPSGMVFYTGDAFPNWRGDVLIGGLTAQGLVRLDLEGEEIVGEERILLGQRIRDVEVGADGGLYVLTDEPDGEILRLLPQ